MEKRGRPKSNTVTLTLTIAMEPDTTPGNVGNKVLAVLEDAGLNVTKLAARARIVHTTYIKGGN